MTLPFFLLRGLRRMIMSLKRQEKFGYGDVFCRVCCRMFQDKRLNIVDYDSCREHAGKIGYRLVDKLNEKPTLSTRKEGTLYGKRLKTNGGHGHSVRASSGILYA